MTYEVKICIICKKNFNKLLLSKNVRRQYSGLKSNIRPKYALTCSRKCSKKYTHAGYFRKDRRAKINAMKIHKTRESRWSELILTKCGIRVRYRKSAYHWKEVNCKMCLRTKKVV